jgi:hypothetical protein
MLDIVIGYCWGGFQVVLGLALVSFGIIGLLRLLRKPQPRHWIRCMVLL